MPDALAKNMMAEDVALAIQQAKRTWKNSIGDVPALLERIINTLESDIQEIENTVNEGRSAWPEVHYDDITNDSVSDDVMQLIKKRGCLVVRGHFSSEQAKQWDKELIDYVEVNDFFNQYRGPGDDFFGTLAASRPEIYPIYWSKPQMEARQNKRMLEVQTFVNGFWKAESEGKQWFDPTINYMFPDRIRRRPPGTTSGGLGAHTDSGSIERWLLPAYQKVFRHIRSGNFDQYDPWDAAYRPEVDEYENGATKCSSFRTFQGWTALSDIQRDQGVLFTVPIPAAMAYLLVRPLLDDVPEDSLCGVSAHKALPVDEQWHKLLLRATSLIPELKAGDSVWWHCDLIHGVQSVTDQQGWGNVMYIPAAPGCEKNLRYAQRCADNFRLGLSPDDFPEEHYEKDWNMRFQWEDLSALGLATFGVNKAVK